MTKHSYGRLVGLALATAAAAAVAVPSAAAADPLPAAADAEQQATDAAEQVSQLPTEPPDAFSEVLEADWFGQLSTVVEELGGQVAEQLLGGVVG